MTTRPVGKSVKLRRAPARFVYPFTALVGQDEMKLALLLNAIAPTIGGVLIMGHRGTGKSTAVRALADLLPPLNVVSNCLFNCDPEGERDLCDECLARFTSHDKFAQRKRPVPVVDLPLGATEDRVCGTIDIERALKDGIKSFEPGLLARANRGFLYIDEVNLLEDHLVDVLLDASVTGRNVVEREGVSVEHPARFVLVGSGNPEEGDLRPQLLDRFGLYTEAQTVLDLDERVEIIERREAFERDPQSFVAAHEKAQAKLRRRLRRAQRDFVNVEVPKSLLREIADLCVRLKADGHRGEITITRAARALAAYEQRHRATADDVRRVAALSLRHRLRRDPLSQTTSATRIDETVSEMFGDAPKGDKDDAASARSERDKGDTPHGNGSDGTRQPTGGGAESGQKNDSRQSPQNELGQSPQSTKDERTISPTEASFPDGALKLNEKIKSTKRTPVSARGEHARRATYGRRGRYARSTVSKTESGVIAVDATLRAAAIGGLRRRSVSTKSGGSQTVVADDLRYKLFRQKAGTLFILAVDASGSMAVNRINQAKGALAHILRRSYLNRDRVALISFRGRDAELLLPPSNAPARAKTILDAMPVGGPTPLAAALARSLEVARSAKAVAARQIVLVLFTDGRANVALDETTSSARATRRLLLESEIERLGVALVEARVSAVVVDTQQRYLSNGEGRHLAGALGGRYVHLPTHAGSDFSEAFEEL
ncbi:MAG: magnesium chelatase ATPase subunit I [Pyrinomonadaceae bacterium]